MKKHLLFLLLMMLPLAVSATPQIIDGIYYNLNSATQTAEVTSHTSRKYSGDIIIPSSVTYEGIEYSVTSIGDNAFMNCFSLTSVNLPNGVKHIGKSAFAFCLRLTSINFPDVMETIEQEAFWNCRGLKAIDIPDNLTKIGISAFGYCNGLTSIDIPSSVSNMGNYAFESCENLTSVTISANLQTIGEGVFMGCRSLESISIPNSVIAIGENAFASCWALSSITLPNRLMIIGDYAFYYCMSLTSVTIPESVQSIGFRAFNLCPALTTIKVEGGNPMFDSREDCNAIIYTTDNVLLVGCQNTVIPNGVESIGSYAFWGNEGLTSIIIPDGMASINEYAFYNCTNVATVVIPNSVTKIEEGAFENIHFKNVYVYAEQVPEATRRLFGENCPQKATLHVPATAVETYKNARYWNEFGSIVALTENDPNPTGIKSVSNSVKAIERYYTIDGKLLSAPQRGLNIIKMSDGKTRKVVIK